MNVESIVSPPAVTVTGPVIVEVDPPGNQTVVKRLSTRKLAGLGWRPTVDLEDGVRRTWAAVKAYGVDGMPREHAAVHA